LPISVKKIEATNDTKEIAPPKADVDIPLFKIHDDIKGLVWIGEKSLRIYTSKKLIFRIIT
jgi:hypothetical protein